ncbi:MAG: RecQ family ATP-dependent DNA helicase [Deltaproteobacteria bacterium]|nr:RecQ family ATP-dependent DNA helicase [Deltaproteobacteria bacterium]
MQARPSLEDAERVLADVFGFTDLRPGQRDAVEAAMGGRDAAVLLPTGAGKSLCYQLPGITLARAGRGPCLVVSPLIALMADQVEALRARGVKASALNSHQSEVHAKSTLKAYRSGELELLYVSPERAAQPGFRRMLTQQRVGFFAIDEAHCVSQWGHDFRPEYMRLAELRELSDAPMMAVTATATARVLEELIRRLGLREPAVVRGDFRRPNLAFSVEHIATHDARTERLVTLLEQAGLREPRSGKAIVYCATRKHTETVAAALKSRGFSARHYHAGRSKDERERAQRAFGAGRLRVLVATSAFGMGIDFPDVRVVAHYQTPGSVEAYYQEAGRAGRDGEPARCVMFFGAGDMATQRRILSGKGVGEALRAIETYAHACECRERIICAHFGVEGAPSCGRCDVCTGAVARVEEPAPTEPVEALTEAQKSTLLMAANELTRPAGKTNLARALRGSRARSLNKCGLLKMSQHAALRGVDERAIVRAIEACLDSGELARKGDRYPTVWPAGKPVRAAKSVDESTTPKRTRRSKRARNAYSPLQGALERFRVSKARELKWKPYMVFQRRTIVALDARRPKTLHALTTIPGLGKIKIERFGHEILEMIVQNA